MRKKREIEIEKKNRKKNHHEKIEKKMRKKCELKRKWSLDNIYVLYTWIVGMFFFFKMCILLSEETIIFWKPSLITTLEKTLGFNFLICL